MVDHFPVCHRVDMVFLGCMNGIRPGTRVVQPVQGGFCRVEDPAVPYLPVNDCYRFGPDRDQEVALGCFV